MNFELITFENQNSATQLTLNELPLNVMNIAMLRETNAALARHMDDPTIKVVVFAAGGGSEVISPGVDIPEPDAEGNHFAELLSKFSSRVKSLGPLGEAEGLDEVELKAKLTEI